MNETSGWPALAASSFSLSRSGPIFPVALKAVNVWQAEQPFEVNVASAPPPAPAGAPPPVVVLPVLEYQAAYAVGFITIASLRISEWPRPQSSTQMTGNVPRRVGVMPSLVASPGIASCFW